MTKINEFENLKMQDNDTLIKASMWNRCVTFENSVMPTSVVVGDDEILDSPITLNAYFGEKKGEWSGHKVICHQKDNVSAVYTLAQTTENLIVNACVKIEADGFMRIDFSIIPFWSFHADNIPRLTELYIDIPLKRKFSGLMHYWPNCESGVCLSKRVLNSHKTPEGKTILPFKPYIWCGWEYGGLGICCESDKGFELNDIENWAEIKRDETSTRLRIHLLDNTPADWQNRSDKWGDTIKPITYSFAFQATPVKQFNKNNLNDWRAFHLYDVSKSSIFEPVKCDGTTLLEKIADSGANWLILHEDWTMIQNYGMPYDEDDFKRFIRECHSFGLKVMVYFGYEVSTLYPQFSVECEQILNKNTNGNFVGGWQREPIQRDFTVCYNGSYSDIMLSRVEYVMDKLGVDGIYTDGTYVPWECSNENHGCGYRDKGGKLCFSYPIYAVREHVKKLYDIVHKRGGLIDTHQSSCCMMATLAFADSYFDGENIQEFIAEDMEKLRLDTLRTEFMGLNMGIPCNFISYSNEGMNIRELSGMTLLHNTYPRANSIDDLPYMSRIWSIFDDNKLCDKKWLPYWENNIIVSDNDNTCISCYYDDTTLTAIIVSLDKKCKNITIQLCDQYAEITDLLDECEINTKGNRLELNFEKSILKIINFCK